MQIYTELCKQLIGNINTFQHVNIIIRIEIVYLNNLNYEHIKLSIHN
jgi:hypothetical protein